MIKHKYKTNKANIHIIVYCYNLQRKESFASQRKESFASQRKESFGQPARFVNRGINHIFLRIGLLG